MDQKNTEAPILYTIKEVAERLKISRPYLDQLIEKKGITPIQFGRAVRFTVDQINQLIGQEKSTD